MIRGLIFCLLCSLFSQILIAGSQSTFKGTLYKKNEDWFLFVKNDSKEMRKGSLKLVINKKVNNELLKNKAFIEAKGEIVPCQKKYICINVSSIHAAVPTPAQNYNPLLE